MEENGRMKYLRFRFDILPRIMYSHSAIIREIGVNNRNSAYFELTLYEEGECKMEIEDMEFTAQAGSFVLCPAKVPYRISKCSPSIRHSCISFFFDNDVEIVEEKDVVFEKYCNQILSRNESIYVPIYGMLRADDPVIRTVKKVIEENRRGSTYTNLKCANLIVEALTQLASAAAERIQARRWDGVPSNRYYADRIDRFLRENYSQALDMNSVAEHVRLHPNYASAIYKKETGNTVMETLRGIRMEAAKKLLLLQSYRVSDIAHMVGFTDENYFASVFKKEEGVPPSEYVASLLRR